MLKKYLFILQYVLLILLLSSFISQAQEPSFSLKKLMMPGEVHRTHAKFEHECDSCHGASTETSANSLCLDCHKVIAQDLLESTGFHGHAPLVKNQDCQACHSEHLGREGDIVNFDADHFDHSVADFQLDGRHIGVTCQSCHLADKKFSEAPQECVACHLKDDKHNGAFKQSCADCHTTQQWNKTTFDHGSTDFVLLGQHQQTSCNACHPDQSYFDTPKECVSCHVLNDVHSGNNGTECKSCHQAQSWQKISFDHSADTDFALLGGHANVSCNACHTSPVFDKKPGNTCVDCHKNDDQHRGLNGTNCQACHTEVNWSETSFDHNTDTEFRLNGAHSELACTNCHQLGSKHKIIGKTCVSCHLKDDAHNGQLGNTCENCHNESNWTKELKFDHELSNFPLLGMHAIATCDSCHATPQFHDAKTACINCHENDDFHNKTLGSNCASCHNPNDWMLWQFDHSLQTDFPLEGEHQGLSCQACHTTKATDKVEQDSACYACHAQDDKHQGRFGRNCQSCHVATGFNEIRIK
jgi:hypothetical protein